VHVVRQLRRKLMITFGAGCYGTALALTWRFKHHVHESLREYTPRFPPEQWLEPEKAVSWMCFVIAGLFGTFEICVTYTNCFTDTHRHVSNVRAIGLSDAAWNTQAIAALGTAAPPQGRQPV
jgi:hypothetical protein